MSLLEKSVAQAIAKHVEPVGTVKVVDPDPLNWLIHPQGAQAADAPLLGLHRAFVGEREKLRTGLASPDFDDLYSKLTPQTNTQVQCAI